MSYFGAINAGGGASGAAIRSGAGVPSAGLGSDGDFYIDTSATTIYGPKTAGSWGSATSLIGPAGSSGVGVPVAGTTDQVLKKNSGTDYDTSWVTPGNLQVIESRTTSTPNATVPVHALTATGAEAAIDLALIPKGTGALLAAVPDNTVVGGNKRGTNSVDLQLSRANATEVASGINAVAIGRNNTASQDGSVAIGNGNSVSVANSVAIGTGHTVTGGGSFAGGNSSTVSGTRAASFSYLGASNSTYSFTHGHQATSSTVQGKYAHGGSAFVSTPGECQFSRVILSRSTTDATPTVLTAGGAAPSATNRWLLGSAHSFSFTGRLVAKQQASANSASWEITGIATRNGVVANTVLNASTVTAIYNGPGWTVPAIAADVVNGALTITVTGVAATNIRWVFAVESSEVIYT